MFTVSIELPESIKVAVGKTGLETIVPVKDMTPEVLRFAVLNGMIGALNNISRGVDANDKALSDSAWAGMRAKKVDVWLGGNWGAVTRSDSTVKLMRDQYVSERMIALGTTAGEIDKAIKAAVKAAFGDKEVATFPRFLDAVAVGKEPKDAAARAEFREGIEAALLERTQAAIAERAKAGNALDVTDLGF